jgi:hypothetical protein
MWRRISRRASPRHHFVRPARCRRWRDLHQARSRSDLPIRRGRASVAPERLLFSSSTLASDRLSACSALRSGTKAIGVHRGPTARWGRRPPTGRTAPVAPAVGPISSRRRKWPSPVTYSPRRSLPARVGYRVRLRRRHRAAGCSLGSPRRPPAVFQPRSRSITARHLVMCGGCGVRETRCPARGSQLGRLKGGANIKRFSPRASSSWWKSPTPAGRTSPLLASITPPRCCSSTACSPRG